MKENEREMPNVEITEEKANNNKKRNLIIAGLVAFVAVVGIGGYILLNQKTDELTLKEDVTYELGETVKLDAKYFLDEKMSEDAIKETKLTSTLMTDTKKYTFDKKKLTVTTKDKKYLDVGNYEISLKLNDEVKDAEFKVEDTTAPKFEDFLSEIRIEKDAKDVDLKSYFKASDLSDFEITIDQGDFDITKEGNYKIKVTAKDKYDNETKGECVVKVVSAEEAEKEGLTENKDGKMAVSEETQKKIDSGQTSVKPSEDKVDSSVNNKPSGGGSNNDKPSGGNTGNNDKPNSGGNTGGNTGNNDKPSNPTCSHNWVAQYETVHHPEKGHNEQYVIKEAWTEQVPRYEQQARTICNTCGADITGNVAPHIKNHMLNGENGSYRTEYVQVQVGTDTIEHPAEYGTRWVVDQAAYDEQVLSGYTCSKCGQTK